MIQTKNQDAVVSNAAISVEIDPSLVRCRFFIEKPSGDAVAVVARVPASRPHLFFRPPGGPAQLGLGVAARVMARPMPGEPWPLSELGEQLRAELGEHLGAGVPWTAFLACAFDPAAPFGPSTGPWHGYSPIELFLPEALLTFQMDRVEVVLLCSAERYPVLEREVQSLVESAGEAGPDDRRSDLGDLAIEWADDIHRDNVVTALAELARPGSGRLDRLDKVVLAHAVEVTRSTPFDPARILSRLGTANPAAYLMSYRPRGGSAVFLGASPERLATVAAGRVISGALAGSAPRGRTTKEDDRLGRELLDSEKDLDEHAIVGEMIATALAPLARNVEAGPGPRLERLPTVQHLFTPITGTLEPGRSILDVALALHPTPAVGGMPRERALEAIRRLEAVPRGLYAGAFGRVDSNGEGDLAVAIRSALISADHARVYAGGGIVPGSDPDLEVEETKLKLAAVLAALAGGAAADG